MVDFNVTLTGYQGFPSGLVETVPGEVRTRNKSIVVKVLNGNVEVRVWTRLFSQERIYAPTAVHVYWDVVLGEQPHDVENIVGTYLRLYVRLSRFRLRNEV